MDPMHAIRETFFQECEEQLGELETGLLAMQDGVSDAETVDAVFRAVHSIKGGAGAFQLDRLVRFAHAFETALDTIRSGALARSAPVMKTMLRAADVLADVVASARDGESADDVRAGELIAELAAHAPAPEPPLVDMAETGTAGAFGFRPLPLELTLDAIAEPPAKRRSAYVVSFRPTAALYEKGNETTRLLHELSRLGPMSVDCDASEVPALSDLDPETTCLTWRICLESDEDEAAVRGVFEFVDGDCALDIACLALDAVAAGDTTPRAAVESPAAPRASNAAKADAAAGAGSGQGTIRVDLDRVDRLINLVGELVINQAMLTQRVLEAGVGRAGSVATGLDDLEHLTRDIQESVMAIRAQPVRPLFQRMSRIVRELAEATGKSVRLKTEGEGAEVDRTVIERLADPLTHMIRNAVDHGLETTEARLAAGKPAEGEVRLSAAHRSDRVIIEVADDGAGIDRARVKSIAIERGLIPPEAQLADAEIDNLLFLPGFSTAETVSRISGRGVGMDVVKRSIQALGGRMSISSRPGRGSTFSMSLPLTLAVLDGMVVRVADHTLIVPLTSILETLKPKPGDVFGLGPDSRLIGIRGGFTPLIDVARELGFRSVPSDPLTGVILLIETEGGVRSALMVDAIQDQRQVVIKSLEANYGRVEGIAAATILGDGRIALILDADAIVAASNRISGRSETISVEALLAAAE